MSDDPAEVIATIEAHYADRLGDWEAQFLDSISRQLEDGRPLTPRQQQKLDEIFERVSNGGRG